MSDHDWPVSDQMLYADVTALWKSALEQAWPGITVKRLVLSYDARPATSPSAETHSNMLSVDLTLYGTPEAFAQNEFCELAEIPDKGQRQIGGFGYLAVRKKRGVSLNVYRSEGSPLKDQHVRPERVWDRMAQILAPRIWKPSAAR